MHYLTLVLVGSCRPRVYCFVLSIKAKNLRQFCALSRHSVYENDLSASILLNTSKNIFFLLAYNLSRKDLVHQMWR